MSKRTLQVTLLAVVVSASGLLAGCYVSGYSTVGVSDAPPDPDLAYVDYRDGYVWVQGHWVWQGNRWVWQQGYWVAERPGYIYTQGYWDYRGGTYIWIGGRWMADRPGYVWSRGYWDYRAGRRVWVRGRFVRSRPGYTWQRGRYVNGRDGRKQWRPGSWAPRNRDHRAVQPRNTRPRPSPPPRRNTRVPSRRDHRR